MDYCLVPEDDLMSIENFTVKRMSQCEEELCQDEEEYRIPDHSVPLWDILAEGVLDVSPMPTKVQGTTPEEVCSTRGLHVWPGRLYCQHYCATEEVG